MSHTTDPTTHVETEVSGALSDRDVAGFRAAFADAPSARLMQNAVTKVSVDDVALDRELVTSMPHTFSHQLDDWKVTNQKKSGRCWAFAGMNLLRVGAREKMNLAEFEFSQNYVLFWDKMEKSNFFLENILATADQALDDREVAFLLERPLDDGGQWNMFVNVVKKHGLVPQSIMPETQSSSATMRMNTIVKRKLREGARDLRGLFADGAAEGDLRAKKDEVLDTIWRVLATHLGTPPTEFDWQWNDKDKAFHREGTMTPQQFAGAFVTIPAEDYVCLVHDPRATSPFGRTYTVKFLGNVVAGKPVVYLNIEIDLMKEIAMRTIQEGEPVWMGCDVGKMMSNEHGLWDAKLYDYEGVYGTEFGLEKAARLTHHETLMTHAMLFTGVDVVADKPRRWRVENSWGEERGVKGYYLMNDSWFDEYMFEIAARKSYLPPELQAALAEEPIVLPPWDPMGSLAV